MTFSGDEWIKSKVSSERKKRKITQSALDDRCGFPKGTVAQIENGRIPTPFRLKKIAAELGVRMEDLV